MLEAAKLLLSPLHVIDLSLSIPQTVPVDTLMFAVQLKSMTPNLDTSIFSAVLFLVRMYLVDRLLLSFADSIPDELLCIGGYLLQNSILT